VPSGGKVAATRRRLRAQEGTELPDRVRGRREGARPRAVDQIHQWRCGRVTHDARVCRVPWPRPSTGRTGATRAAGGRSARPRWHSRRTVWASRVGRAAYDADRRIAMGAAPRFDGDDATVGLTDRARQLIDSERQWWKYAGAKEQAIKDLFDMSATRYYQ